MQPYRCRVRKGRADRPGTREGLHPEQVRVPALWPARVPAWCGEVPWSVCLALMFVPCQRRSEHWFALRRLGAFWFDLNSTQPMPKLLSDTYLSLFLDQNRQEGYSIFVVRGDYPPAEIESKPRDLQAAAEACRAYYSVRFTPTWIDRDGVHVLLGKP